MPSTAPEWIRLIVAPSRRDQTGPCPEQSVSAEHSNRSKNGKQAVSGRQEEPARTTGSRGCCQPNARGRMLAPTRRCLRLRPAPTGRSLVLLRRRQTLQESYPVLANSSRCRCASSSSRLSSMDNHGRNRRCPHVAQRTLVMALESAVERRRNRAPQVEHRGRSNASAMQ